MPPSRKKAARLLQVNDLCVDFNGPNGPLRAVDSVSIDLDYGEVLGIVGESGSGKSVLLRALMGLTPSRVAVRTGSVCFEGRQLIGPSRRQLRRLWGTEIAIVFQDPMTSLNPVVRIGRQISEAVRPTASDKLGDVRTRALELLRLVGIPEPARRFRQYPHELSGGMLQRVAIAIALAGSPKLLLADEPTTSLDVTIQAQILDLLSELQTKLGMAMIIVSHDLGVVATRTDRIAVMYGGEVVETAPPRALFLMTHMPYTEGLIRSIPALEEPRHSRLYTIGGRPPTLHESTNGCRFAPRCPYGRPMCHRQPPPLMTAPDSEHQYRCWYPLAMSESPSTVRTGTGA